MPAEEADIGPRDPEDHDGYVPVVYAEDLDEAERYCQLLEDHDIPAIVDEDYEGLDTPDGADIRQGVPVLAPEIFREEAGGLIQQLEEMDPMIDENGEFVQDDDAFNGEAGGSLDHDDYDEDEGLDALAEEEDEKD